MHVNTRVLSKIHDPLHQVLYRNFTSRINIAEAVRKSNTLYYLSVRYILKEKSNLPYTCTSVQFNGKKYFLVYHIDWPQKELTKNKSPKRNV